MHETSDDLTFRNEKVFDVINHMVYYKIQVDQVFDYIKKEKISNIYIGPYFYNGLLEKLCESLCSEQCPLTFLALYKCEKFPIDYYRGLGCEDKQNIFENRQNIELFENALHLNKSLKGISIRSQVVPFEVSNFIVSNQTLEIIKITSPIISDPGLCINIQVIDSECHVKNGISYLIKILSHRSGFKAIKISHCSITSFDTTQLIETIKKNIKLTTLSFYHNRIGHDDMMKIMNAIKFFADLQVLHIKDKYHIKKDFMYFCEQLKYIPHLKTLVLHKCNLNNEHFCSLIESMKQCKQLEELDVSGNLIDSGFDHLYSLIASNPNLTILKLFNNPMSTKGMEELKACLMKAKTLKSLYLDTSNFGYNNISQISAIINISVYLTTLSIENVNVNTVGKKHLNDLFISLIHNISLKSLIILCKPMYVIDFPIDSFECLLNCLEKNNSITNFFGCMSDDQLIKVKSIIRHNKIWSHVKHKKLTFPAFQQSLHTFLLCLKANQFKTKLKIPKFVLFEIIKSINRKSFLPLSAKNKNPPSSSTNIESPLKKLKK